MANPPCRCFGDAPATMEQRCGVVPSTMDRRCIGDTARSARSQGKAVRPKEITPGTITSATCFLGYHAGSFDLVDHESENLLLPGGLVWAIIQTLRGRDGGHVKRVRGARQFLCPHGCCIERRPQGA
eukprot:9469529-Pyramimonas_sp.AAC.1